MSTMPPNTSSDRGRVSCLEGPTEGVRALVRSRQRSVSVQFADGSETRLHVLSDDFPKHSFKKAEGSLAVGIPATVVLSGDDFLEPSFSKPETGPVVGMPTDFVLSGDDFLEPSFSKPETGLAPGMSARHVLSGSDFFGSLSADTRPEPKCVISPPKSAPQRSLGQLSNVRFGPSLQQSLKLSGAVMLSEEDLTLESLRVFVVAVLPKVKITGVKHLYQTVLAMIFASPDPEIFKNLPSWNQPEEVLVDYVVQLLFARVADLTKQKAKVDQHTLRAGLSHILGRFCKQAWKDIRDPTTVVMEDSDRWRRLSDALRVGLAVYELPKKGLCFVVEEGHGRSRQLHTVLSTVEFDGWLSAPPCC